MALAQALLNTGKELGLNRGVQLQSPPFDVYVNELPPTDYSYAQYIGSPCAVMVSLHLNTLRLVQVNIYLFLVYIFRVLIYQRILLYFTFNKKFDLELMQKLFEFFIIFKINSYSILY